MRIDEDNMPKCILMIRSNHDGYSPDQIPCTMTVGELRDILDMFNDDTPVMFDNDKGYTYGAINSSDIAEAYERDDYKCDLDW